MSSVVSKPKLTMCQRTPGRLEVINLLFEYRSLTTRQIKSLLEVKGIFKTLRRVQSDLQALMLAGMVQSFAVNSEIGPRSESGWILLKPGARWTGLESQYGNQYRRLPSPEQLVYTALRLELEKAITSAAGWKLERPQTCGRMVPLPNRTPQHFRLAEALTWREFFASGRWPVGGVKGSHILGAPLKTNDYLAYSIPREVPVRINNTPVAAAVGITLSYLEQTGTSELTTAAPVNAYSEHVVVFILCPPKASEKFWLARIRQYEPVARQLLVVGVFESEEKALNHKALLQKGGLRVTTLNRIKTVLEDVWKPGR